MAEILPEDSGIIRCICDYDHDDNFTIQCERCNAWQHAKCVGIDDETSVPDNYLCPECSDQLDKADRNRARAHQRYFLQQKQDSERQQIRGRGNDDDHEENRRRRGGRKRNADLDLADKVPSASSGSDFNSKFFGVPATESLWTSRAENLWSNLMDSNNKDGQIPSLVSPKELKSPAPLRITRSKLFQNSWRFGVQAGAVVSTANLSSNKLVCEVVGEMMLRSEYCAEPTNQFARLGCPKPGVMFVPGLSLAIDTRRRGAQSALFLRRSSDPNARLVTRRDSKNNLRVLVYTRKPVKAGAELSIGWHWPENHPVRKVFDSVDKQEQSDSQNIVETIMWLLDTDLKSCRPIEHGEELEEDWEVPDTPESPETNNIKLEPSVEPVPRRPTRAEELFAEHEAVAKTDDADPGTALTMRVWVPAPQDVAPPPKKRMSLKDYMRKRT